MLEPIGFDQIPCIFPLFSANSHGRPGSLVTAPSASKTSKQLKHRSFSKVIASCPSTCPSGLQRDRSRDVHETLLNSRGHWRTNAHHIHLRKVLLLGRHRASRYAL